MGNSKHNIQVFAEWAASKTRDEFSQMIYRGSLHREEIALACGFAKSVLRQNPAIKAQLHALEDRLRQEGVLPNLDSLYEAQAQENSRAPDAELADVASRPPGLHHKAKPSQECDQSPSKTAHSRSETLSSLESSVRRLQSENASQRAEIQELRRQLAKYAALQDALSITGRLPR